MARRPSPIVQRLALEGGDEVIAELKRLGLAGEVAGRELKKRFDALNKTGLDPFTASLKRAQAQMQALSKSFVSVGRQFTSVGRTMSFAVTAPIVAGFGFAIKAATDFESKMADIARVTEAPSPAAFDALGESLRKMAVELGVSIGDLQDIATEAGKAGIAFGELANFTELVAKAAIALDLSFGETGNSLAKIRAALGLTIPQIDLMVDAIAKLADGAAVTDAQIIEIVQRIGSVGKVAGLNELEMAALSATLVGMGADSETAGTGIRNLLLNLTKGETATKSFQTALNELGLDAVDVAQRMQTDGIGTIIDLFERLGKESKADQLSLLGGLVGRRDVAALAPLINSLNELKSRLELVGDEANFAGQALREFARRAETPAQRFRVFQATLNELAITIGSELMPLVLDLTERITDLFKAFADSPSIVKWGVALAGVAAAAGPFIFAIGQTLNAIGLLIKGGALLLGQFAAIRTAFLVGGLAAAAAAAPFTALVAVIGAVTVGTALLATRYSEAGRAARTHAEAVAHLDGLLAQAKAGVEGAAEATREYAQAQILAARAVIESARAELERFNIINEFGQQQEQVIGGPDITTMRDQLARIDDFQRRLDELAASGEKSFSSTTEGAREAGEAAAEAGEKVRRAFPGPAANVRHNPFNSTTEGAKEAGDEAESSGERVEQAFGKVVSVTETLGPAAQRAGREAADGVGTIAPAVDAVGTAIQEAKEDFLGIGPAFEEIGRQSSNAFTGAGESVTLFGSVANDTLQGIEEQATQTATALPGLFQTAANTMAQAFIAAFAQVRSELAALQAAVTSALNAMAASLAALRREIAATRAAASAAASSAAAATSGGGGGSGFASGGQVFGPGTATSDSIPAYLSAGEFVVRAKAVDHYGPQIFAALNSLRLPKFPVPRFNAGGIVDSINHSIGALRFNTGGMVPAMAGASGGGRSVTFVLDNQPVEGFSGTDDAIDRLGRLFSRQKLTRASRGPARL